MASRQHVPPADLLLKQYIRLAQDFTDAASPQDNFLATIASDWRYERALQGIRLLSQHHLGHLVQTLITWRQNVNEEIKKNFSTNNVVNLQGVCKRAAMEVLFLEAAMQVLDEFVPEFWRERQFQNFFESMQHVSFRWLVNSEEYVPHQELSLVRQHVVLVSGRIVGALSRIRLADVTGTFVKKLEERVAPRGKDAAGPRPDQNLLRAQALKLCAGMRSVVLSFDSDAQLEQSTKFLQRAHPLNYTAPVKKSQIHHALCEMLTDVLTPLVRSNQPHGGGLGLNPSLLADWYGAVLRLKNDIGQWANKHQKHITVGYPLVTVLVCLVDAKNYNVLVDSMADFLAKQMKVKEYRSLCFKCLNLLVTSSLVRNRGAAASPAVVAWLDRVVKPVLAAARKGGIPLQEQQDFVSDMADLNPEYCVGSVLADLLACDSPEGQLIALRTLHQVATSVPADSAAALEQRASAPRRSVALSGSGVGGAVVGSRRMVQLPAGQVLDLIRGGQHPFELQGIGHLLPRVQSQLAGLLSGFHRTLGPYLLFGSESVPRDRQPQVALFSGLVRLVPYLKPDQWAGLRPLDLLPSYTAHVEGTVRASAFDALAGAVRGVPALRGAVLANMAALIAAIPDEAVQTTRECLLLLRNLMESWLGLLEEQRLASSSLCGAGGAEEGVDAGGQCTAAAPFISADPASAARLAQAMRASRDDKAPPHALRASKDAQLSPLPGCPEHAAAAAAASSDGLSLDLHKLEGVLFMLLCSCDEAVRCDAYCLLDILRTLHQQLCSMAEALLLQLSAGEGATVLVQASPAAGAGVAGSTCSSAGSGSFIGVPEGGQAAAGGGGGGGGLAAAGNGGGGGGIFSRHKPAMSRDSAEFMQTLGQLEVPDAGATCIMDVLEEVGDDVARRCYWDFGDWSDLWRETKAVPADVTLQSVMSASDEVGRLRYLRCLVELVRAACHMCPTSTGVAYLEMLHKLSRYLTRDSSGRLVIPTDPSEGRRSEGWKAFVVVACVCPPSLRERVERAAARKGAALTARELIRSLLASLTAGPAIPQQVCLMALGHASPEHYPALCEELPGLMEEYQRPARQRRGAARPEEARKVVANVMRLVADAMPAGTLAAQPAVRARFLDWLRETALHLRGLVPFGEAFWDVSQVAYCLCAVSRCVGAQLSGPLTLPLALIRDHSSMQRAGSSKSAASEPSTPGTASAQGGGGGAGGVACAGSSAAADVAGAVARSGGSGSGGQAAAAAAGQPMARRVLFDLFSTWCEDGSGRANEYASRLSAGVGAALARVKEHDVESREGLRQELTQSAELLDQAARLAMAAMLQGPVFDTDARRSQGPVLSWVDRLLQAPPLGVSAGRVPAVPRDAVGRSALFNLLRSNLDMFPVCVDRCYHKDPRIATGSFQVVSEVYALSAVKVEPHVVLSLVLYKMVDASPEIREDALHMLHVLSTREWQASPGGAPAGWRGGGAAAAAAAAAAAEQQQAQQDEAFALEAEGGSGTVVVLGALQDSYQQFQYQLAVKLARDHPELSEALCEEMMTRQLELADKVSQHPVLTCLGPWMENLTIAAHWKGTWCERLLKSMYYVTLRHGDELPLEIERLWSTLAANRRNIIPVLDFLASLGTHMAYQELASMLEYLGVSKRICLYLARISPQQTIDHLVYEISLQLHEEEGAAAAGGPGAAAGAAAAAAEAAGRPAGGGGGGGGAPLQFASLLLQETGAGGGFAARDRASAAAAVAAAAGGGQDNPLMRSSASSWWACSSSSSITSSAMGGPPERGGGLPSMSASATGALLGGALGSPGGPPAVQGVGGGGGGGGFAAAAASFASPATSQAVAEQQQQQPSAAMRLSHTLSSALGMGGGGGGPSGAGADGGTATLQRSATDASDSSRSSLSLPEGSAQATPTSSTPPSAGAAGGGGGGCGLPAPPRPIAVGVAATTVAPPGRPPSANQFSLGAYFGAGGVAGAGGGAARPLSAGLLRDDGGGGRWPGGGRERRPSPRATREPSSPVLRGLVTRPELALCLLTEVAYEHDEDFGSHLALLCHVALLLVDHEEHLVAAAAQQLLINCLYSLSARHLEVMQEEGQQVECLQATHLIKYLQAMKGRHLWSYEDVTLERQDIPSAAALGGLVRHCLNALSFERGLPEAWCGVALEWALHARNRHLACRSQQVLRALRPPLTSEMCGALLTSVQQCLAVAPGSAVAREVALELLLTLRALLGALPPRKLLLYPQLFWASLSIHFTPYVHIYQQALALLSSCLRQLPLHDSTTQNVLLAAAPAGDPANLQALLARSQQAAAWLDGGGGSAGGAPPDSGAAALRGSGARAAAPRGAAGPAGPAAPAVPGLSCSVSGSYVGGADPDGARPMHWAVGQLLPWPDRGRDGPAGQMIALQQVLFKGLLLPETQLPAVRLISQLARGLAQLAPSAAAAPVQAPAGAPGDAWGSRDYSGAGGGGAGGLDGSRGGGGSGRRAGTPGSGGSTTSSSRTGSRAATGTPSRSSSRESPRGAGGAQAAQQQQTSGRPRAARLVGASLQQEQLLGHAAAPPPPPPLQQQQQQQQLQQPVAAAGGGAQGRASSGATQADPSSLSRSAPELRGFGAMTRHGHTIGGSSVLADVAAAARGGGARQAAATAQHADRFGTKRAAGLLSSSQTGADALGPGAQAAGGAVDSSWGAWPSGTLQLAGGALSDGRRPPGGRAVFQSLLGHRHAQLLASIAAVVPFFCSQLGQLEPESELLDALQDCVLTLSAACFAQGLGDLGSKLQLFATGLNLNSGLSGAGSGGGGGGGGAGGPRQRLAPQLARSSHHSQAAAAGRGLAASGSFAARRPGGGSGAAAASHRSLAPPAGPYSPSSGPLVHLLQGLCLQLSRALLPTYADWLLRFWVGMLILPGAAALHPHVLLLLRCLFDVPGLQLGPGMALLADPTFTTPIVNLSQGPLCQYALDALDSIIHFASSSPELQHYQAAAQQGAAPPPVDPQGLAACLLPQLDVVELLQRVMDSCGNGGGGGGATRRRKHRLLPFVADAAAQQCEGDRDE